ncbi:MAG: putative peptidoglycan lipid II flippase [Rickettsiales bacterium]|jgi:putative peptidoglycan lipid II flippase
MRLFKSALTISFFISLSRISGFIRDILIAKYLGTGMLSDVFFAVFKLPNFFRRVFAEGAFNSAFIPLFVEKLANEKNPGEKNPREKNPGEKNLGENNSEDAKNFVRNILSFLLFALLILVIVFQIFMPFITKAMFFGFYSDPEKFDLLVTLSRITIFYLLFISVVSLFSGVLNSIGKFAAPSSAPIIANITLIASLFILAPFVPNLAYALSWGVFVSGILQTLWLGYFLFRAKMLVYPKFPKFNIDIKHFFKKLGPGIIGANVMQINLLFNTMIASFISGAISYIYYADRINQLPLAMIGIAINIALLPTLSKAIKSNSLSNAIRLQNVALEASLILIIPAAIALICLAHPIIEVLFQRGAFLPKDTLMVSKALIFYSFGLPAFVMAKVLEPSFFARGDTKTPMKIAIFCVLFNIVLTLIFFKPFGYLGIILAVVIASYLNVALMIISLTKRKHFIFESDFLKKLFQIFIPAALMGLMLFFLNKHLLTTSPMINLILNILAGLMAYLILSYFSGALNILKAIKKPNAT